MATRLRTTMGAALAGTVLSLSGCCRGELICVGAVHVHFNRAAALPYTVEARTLGDSLLARVDCSGNAPCSMSEVDLTGVQAEQFVVRVVELGMYVSTGTVTPNYENVSVCGNCLTADVTFQLGTH